AEPVAGLTARCAADGWIPMRPGKFVSGKAAVIEARKGNADNATSRTDWTPVRGGVSADGQHGFTFGYMTIHRGDNTSLPLKYLAYWVKRPEGWRVAAFKRTRPNGPPPPLAPVPPAVPARIVPPKTDAAAPPHPHERL